MVQVIPGKYLLHTRKRIGFPPAPASTNWENHHFISMWSPPDTGTNCILLLSETPNPLMNILNPVCATGGLRKKPRWCFCISLVAKTEEGAVLSNSVFWVLAYLPVPTPRTERTTQRRSSMAFLVLKVLAAFHFVNLLRTRLFTISSLQYLLFAFGWWEEKLLSSPATKAEAFSALVLQNYFPPLITSHFSTSTLLVLLSWNSWGEHGIVTAALIRDCRMQL